MAALIAGKPLLYSSEVDQHLRQPRCKIVADDSRFCSLAAAVFNTEEKENFLGWL
jgi:hypothetical protein